MWNFFCYLDIQVVPYRCRSSALRRGEQWLCIDVSVEYTAPIVNQNVYHLYLHSLENLKSYKKFSIHAYKPKIRYRYYKLCHWTVF